MGYPTASEVQRETLMFPRKLSSRSVYSFLFLLSAILGVTIGCQKKIVPTSPDSAPVIPVSRLVEREVTDYADYTGRTDAVLAVNVRARATGYLLRTRFEEGAEVKEGDLLFQIDPLPYEIQVKQAVSQVKSAEAALVSAQATVDADREGITKTGVGVGGVISKLQLITDEASLDGAKARLDGAKATLENAKLNLSFTRVEAQINGQISRYYYTPGNLITQDQTLLTTIVAMDYMYAYFDIEERIFARIIKEISSNKGLSITPVDSQSIRAVAGGMTGLTPLQVTNFPVLMAIEGQTGFPYRGKLDFINNQVNPSTGTVAVRGYFQNPRQKGGLVSLIPGMFVRIRLPLGNGHKAQLIIDRAIGSDQGIKYVYVLDAEKRVQYRRIVPGALQEDGLRVIEPYKPATKADEMETGVKSDEMVIVGGLQQLRPRLKIQPEEIPMPTLATDAVARLKPLGSSGGASKGAGEKNAKK